MSAVSWTLVLLPALRADVTRVKLIPCKYAQVFPFKEILSWAGREQKWHSKKAAAVCQALHI